MVNLRWDFVIDRHVAVGPLRFGMSRQDVYQVLGQPSWCRGPDEFSSLTSEQFETHCCFVEFTPDGRCCAAELYPDAQVVLDGMNLMPMTYKSLASCLRAKGASVVETGDGLRSDDLGIACYASEAGDPDIPDARVESVLVYQRGYYDESDQYVAALRRNNDN